MNKKLKVGFIGLGLMGHPMALNIAKQGFELVVYNRTASKAKDLSVLGIAVVSSPAELAKDVDVIITMVTGPKEVAAVLLGKAGVVKTAKPGLIVVDMSTIGPIAARDIAKKLAQHKIEFLDAPVTGSTPKAISGELTIFIGGDQQNLNRVTSVLEAMGSSLHYLGPTGSGQAMKLINNLIVASTMVALSEGMLLADLQGLPREKVAQALSDVPAVSPFMKLKLPNMVRKKYPVLFSAANMAKDLKLATQEVKQSRRKLANLKLVQNYYQMAATQGYAEQDISAVIEVVEKASEA